MKLQVWHCVTCRHYAVGIDGIFLCDYCCTAWRGAIKIKLSKQAARLFRLILLKPALVTQDDIFESVYGDDPDNSPDYAYNCIRVLIHHMKSRFAEIGVELRSRHTLGYELIDLWKENKKAA
jgi:DNA-binding response OmpR family regulator